MFFFLLFVLLLNQTGIIKLSHSNCALAKYNIFCPLHNFKLTQKKTTKCQIFINRSRTCQINKYIKKQITGGNCHIWKGQQLTSYRIFEFRFRKHKIKLCVHRVKMYIHNGCRAIDTVQYVSHLCHNKLCVWIGHLSLETSQINNNRYICKHKGECTGHYGFARCIFVLTGKIVIVCIFRFFNYTSV